MTPKGMGWDRTHRVYDMLSVEDRAIFTAIDQCRKCWYSWIDSTEHEKLPLAKIHILCAKMLECDKLSEERRLQINNAPCNRYYVIEYSADPPQYIHELRRKLCLLL